MTLCERMSNTCPSKRNCQRHESERSMEFSAASLNSRREAGASACDLWIPINPPKSTFGVDAKTLE